MAADKGYNEEDWERLFREETPEHIQNSINVMEEEVYSEFRLRLGGDIVMSNYWRLKFILARSMDK